MGEMAGDRHGLLRTMNVGLLITSRLRGSFSEA